MNQLRVLPFNVEQNLTGQGVSQAAKQQAASLRYEGDSDCARGLEPFLALLALSWKQPLLQ